MGEYITATEASRRYHISEKTIRTWLKTGKLPAHKARVDGLDQWQINTEEIEQVIAQKHSRIDTTGIVLVEMQRQIDELRAEIDALKQGREPYTAQPPPTTRSESVKPTIAHPGAIPEELPSGSQHIQDFLAAYDLKSHRRRIIGYMDAPSNGLQFHSFQKANRPTETDRFLTLEQQEALLEWLHAHHPDVFTGPGDD